MNSSMAISLLILLFLGVNNSKGQDTSGLILFDYHRSKNLTLPSKDKTQSLQVKDKMKCFGKCIEIDWCQSGNFKTTPEDNGLHVCQLLPSDRFTKTNALKDDPVYENFNIKTPCHIKNKPCLNEGKCVFKNSKHQCECKNGYSGEQCEIEPPKSCKELLQRNSSLTTGLYPIFPTGTHAIKVYCDMVMEGGGWTLVYSYTFTRYYSFTSGFNAVTPLPSWPISGNVPISNTAPLNENNWAALEFKLWKNIGGEEIIVKSNINHWILCKEGPASLVNSKPGSITCRVIKNVASTCHDSAPTSLVFENYGVSFLRGSSYYIFDGMTNAHWPSHDPCGQNSENHKKDVINPHGNIYIR
ncbi:uncharacterized protein LOC110232529 [Exaiptasia diaphana]|uniref:Uncharacterized protein n=1 Tax=Exaiptasia diaphana TaxID=2652724 RepID=A0A913WSF7_EXADI|nr:uncharacterized protein LOC110232529 [Exaiptasia diaphana]